jgi:hypothetical protein
MSRRLLAGFVLGCFILAAAALVASAGKSITGPPVPVAASAR